MMTELPCNDIVIIMEWANDNHICCWGDIISVTPVKLSTKRKRVYLFYLYDDGDDGEGDENVITAIGLLSKTASLHVYYAFLYISLPAVTARLRLETT